MRLFLLLPLFVFCAFTLARAADEQALHSADCAAALDRLQAQEDRQRDAGAMDDAARARWQALRAAAARHCLGGDGALVSPSQHVLRSPIAVAPVSSPAGPRFALSPPMAALPPARPLEPPLTILSCDPAGCTASDGSRYARTGSGLVGPKGLCRAQGTLLQCP